MEKVNNNSIPELSIVIPVYCEGEHISSLLEDVVRVLASVDVTFEFVLVDDGSTDKTWAVLNEQAPKFPMLRAIRLSRNFGKELALCAGLETARGSAVIVMDGDGQHPPALLLEMIRLWCETDVEIVEAVKTNRGKETILGKLGAKAFYFVWNRLSGFELNGASDYKLLSRQAVDAYLNLDERNVFFRGMTAWLGFERASVPFEVVERSSGGSSWSLFRLVKLALTGITSFSAAPLQIVTFSGLLFMLFALVFGLQTLYVFIIGHAVSGFATVIILLLIIGSLLMISLGIIGEYIARIYDEVKRRPRYLIAESIGLQTQGLRRSSKNP
ncbi:MAG: glycosyltransferase family 2 protein [Pyrinomonadaceae bacterium]